MLMTNLKHVESVDEHKKNPGRERKYNDMLWKNGANVFTGIRHYGRT